MLADIFNKEITASNVVEASALGAAYLAMFATGEVDNIKVLLPGMKKKSVIYPSGENHFIYMKNYELSKHVYESLYPNT